MKKFRQLFLPFIALCMCLAVFAGCGGKFKNNPTPTYTAYHTYLKDLGGKQRYDDLTDSSFGKFDLTVTAYGSSTEFHFFFSTGSAYINLFIDFYRDRNHPVRIYYYESYRNASELELRLTANSTNLNSSTALTVTKVEMKYGDNGEYTDVPYSDPLNSSIRSAAQNTLQCAVSWITASLRVALDNDYITVQDLSAQS